MRAGVHPAQIGRWENGKTLPGDRARAKVARALGVPVADIFPALDLITRTQMAGVYRHIDAESA